MRYRIWQLKFFIFFSLDQVRRTKRPKKPSTNPEKTLFFSNNSQYFETWSCVKIQEKNFFNPKMSYLYQLVLSGMKYSKCVFINSFPLIKLAAQNVPRKHDFRVMSLRPQILKSTFFKQRYLTDWSVLYESYLSFASKDAYKVVKN